MPSPLAASIGVFYDESFVSVVPAAAPLSQPEPEPGSGAFNVAAGSSTLGAALAWAGPPAWAGPCQPRRPPCGAQGCPCPRPAESPLEALFGPRGLGPAAPQPGGPPPHRASASAGQWRRWDLTGTGRGLGSVVPAAEPGTSQWPRARSQWSSRSREDKSATLEY